MSSRGALDETAHKAGEGDRDRRQQVWRVGDDMWRCGEYPVRQGKPRACGGAVAVWGLLVKAEVGAGLWARQTTDH
jgi:hypothetical protein